VRREVGGHSRFLDPVQDPAVEVKTEEPHKDVAEDRRCIPKVEFIRLDQVLNAEKCSSTRFRDL